MDGGMRNAKALIIGLDGYAGEDALTSCVQDAVQFRDALIQRGLVAEQDAELLTLPATAGATAATVGAIRARLFEYYANGDQIDRFFFFYAGHGILANANASRTRTHTVLVPTECEDMRRDAGLLLPFDELRETMERCGPREQFYFIDACRDLVEDRNPDVGTLGFAGTPASHARSQSVLFAVSPLGTARAAKHGLGVMTGHLVEALQSDRLAVDYDDEQGRFVITVQSLKRYTEARIAASLQNEPSWTLRYQLPELRSFGPSASALVVVESPPEVPLTVHIDPDRVAAKTRVSVYLRGSLVQAAWPPLANHQHARLGPQTYRLKAQHPSLPIEPTELTVDLRHTNEARFRVVPGEEKVAEVTAIGTPQVSEAHPGLESYRRTTRYRIGTVSAITMEPTTTIELEGQAPPYLQIRRYGRLVEQVAAGTYRVRFRLGDRVQSETEIEVTPDAIIKVLPSLEASPLLHEALDTRRFVEAALLSETIGPMQSGVLQTLLAMIGIKHLDIDDQLFHQLTSLVRAVRPEDYQRRPIVVVVALDGKWPELPEELLPRIACEIDADHAGTRQWTKPIQPLASRNIGYARIGAVVAWPARHSFPIVIRSPELGVIRIAAAAVDGRATIATVVARPDGSVDISQSILAFPGEPDPIGPHAPYGRLVRTLQLGQLLYRSGDLIDYMLRGDDPLFRELMDAKWIDPVVTVMAFFAHRRAVAAGTLNDPGDRTFQLAHTVADNLVRSFGSLPDSQVVYALTFPDERNRVLDRLLDANAVPILADAAVELAARAHETQRDAAVVAAVATMVPGQIWCLCREAAAREAPSATARDTMTEKES